jgi:Protein of unknown function (DUF2630)
VNDADILSRIKSMVDEERDLLERTSQAGPADTEHARLVELQVGLDQCWDLLRQRRALREFGRDPANAQVRDETTVERYQQ